jgi:prephenate dehydrogenase
LIVGAGLIGASVGAALSRAGVDVRLSDIDQGNVLLAQSLGSGSAEPVADDAVRMVVVAVPPDALAEVVASSLRRYPNATVTDVGSVKGTILKSLDRAAHDLSRYVGSHPMAGSEHSGPLNAHADLFQDRTWVITPHDTSSAHAVLDVQELIRACGGRPVSLGAAHHDEAVAQVSHVPQLVSALMAGLLTAVPPEHLRLAGQGLRDVTRIADSDPVLWRQIITANSDAVLAQLRVLHAHLDWLLDGFSDPEKVQEFLKEGRLGRQALPGKHGARPREFASVVVEIPDAPGSLAQIFADIEAAGVNIEDVSIDHDLNREIGFLAVQVDPARSTELETSLARQGWTIRDPKGKA